MFSIFLRARTRDPCNIFALTGSTLIPAESKNGASA
jgi:hypothetical protein